MAKLMQCDRCGATWKFSYASLSPESGWTMDSNLWRVGMSGEGIEEPHQWDLCRPCGELTREFLNGTKVQ